MWHIFVAEKFYLFIYLVGKNIWPLSSDLVNDSDFCKKYLLHEKFLLLIGMYDYEIEWMYNKFSKCEFTCTLLLPNTEMFQ